MAIRLPPVPPGNDVSSALWKEWFTKLQNIISGTATTAWTTIDFAGSNLTSIRIRNHEDLQSMLGGAAGDHYHFTGAEHTALQALTGIIPISRGGTNSGTALSGTSLMMSSGTAIVQGGILTNTGGTALTFPNISTPSTPASGNISIYSKTGNSHTQLYHLDEGGTELNVLRDNILLVRNVSGGTLAAGTLVNINGATGQIPNAIAANNTTPGGHAEGALVESIANNGFGLMISLGIVSNLNTSAFTTGDIIYTGTSGAFTATAPSLATASFVQRVGVVTNAHATQGSILVTLNAYVQRIALTTDVTGILPVLNGGTGVSTSTGSGSVVLSNSPTLVTPLLGTPTSGTLTNCTGLPVSSGVSGLGTSVATALAVNVGSAGAFVVNGGALGTPSSGTLTSCTGLPLSTGVSGTLSPSNGGTGVSNNAASTLTISGNFATTLTVSAVTSVTLPTSGTLYGTATGSITSAQLAASLSDETGTGKVVFATDAAVGGTWTASTAWTLPAHTLGGTVSGGGNQINNVIIGTSTPLAGTFTALTCTSLTNTSDERLKDNIRPFNRGLQDVSKIEPILYTFLPKEGLDSSRIYAGLSAQNVLISVPEAVISNNEGYLGVSDMPLIAALINSVKELDKRTAKLEKSIWKTLIRKSRSGFKFLYSSVIKLWTRWLLSVGS